MGLLIHPELTLDCGFSSRAWVPRSIREFLDEVSAIDSVSAKVVKLEDYANRLQEEMNKISVFKTELSLSKLLISDAIATVKEELRGCKKSVAEPVLEEFIPLKKIVSDDEKDDKIGDAKDKEEINTKDKMNWMSSVQLWNSGNLNLPVTDKPNPYKPPTQSFSNTSKKRKEEPRNELGDLLLRGKNRSFAPLTGCSNFPVMMFGKERKDEHPGLPALSLGTPEIKNSNEVINSSAVFSPKPSPIKSVASSPSVGQSSVKSVSQQQTSRKQRRCWSPELHRRFVNALQHLGGAQAATPKQIRELMQVDGLTNDEVKSHLQKYRLHTRKVSPGGANGATAEPVLLGSLWLPQGQAGESSKMSNSQSGSPEDHLPDPEPGSPTSGGVSGVEDEDDGKSLSPNNHLSVRDGV